MRRPLSDPTHSASQIQAFEYHPGRCRSLPTEPHPFAQCTDAPASEVTLAPPPVDANTPTAPTPSERLSTRHRPRLLHHRLPSYLKDKRISTSIETRRSMCGSKTRNVEKMKGSGKRDGTKVRMIRQIQNHGDDWERYANRNLAHKRDQTRLT